MVLGIGAMNHLPGHTFVVSIADRLLPNNNFVGAGVDKVKARIFRS